MELKDLLPLHPKMDDGELNAWLMEHGGRGREVLTYRKVRLRNPLTEQLEPWAECTCSVCEAVWHTHVYGYKGSYPEFENHDGCQCNGSITTCPECGAQVEAAYYTRLKRYPIRSTKYPWEILKRDGCIIFLCWAVIYEIDDCGPALYPNARNAYVLDPNGKWHRFTAMERSGWSSMCKMEYTGQWYEMNKFSIADGNFRNILPHEADVYEGTGLENAKLEKLEAVNGPADLLLYSRIYTRHNDIENIAGTNPKLMTALLTESYGVTDLDWLNWESSKPHEMMYMEKPEYRESTQWTLYHLAQLGKEQKAVAACIRWGAPKSYAQTLGEAGTEFAFNRKNRHLMPWGLVRTWNYILKINREYARKAKRDTLVETIRLCEDYWNDMNKAGLDTTNSVVVFPKDITEAHARALVAIKYAESEEYRPKFQKMAKKLAALEWSHEGLVIFPAKGQSELIVEGKILSHCVGGYSADHCAGKSIFFIRHEEDPEMPFYTLQLDIKTGRVMQNRGLKNRDRTPEVRAFEEAWLREIVIPWVAKNKSAPERKKEKTEKEKAA